MSKPNHTSVLDRAATPEDLRRLDAEELRQLADELRAELIDAVSKRSRLIIVLNDNDMSIAPPVGAMSAYLSRLISSNSYRSFRHLAKDVAKLLPKPMERAARRAEEYARGLVAGGTLFEEM